MESHTKTMEYFDEIAEINQSLKGDDLFTGYLTILSKVCEDPELNQQNQRELIQRIGEEI